MAPQERVAFMNSSNGRAEAPPLYPEESPVLFNHSRLSLEVIQRLPQPRKTFEHIGRVANNIARLGLLQAIIVVCLDNESCQAHLDFINHIWRTDFKTDDLESVVEEGKESFYILLAGERRFRSMMLLKEIGCEGCCEKYGERAGPCFLRHFPSGTVPVSLGVNVDPEESVKVQLSENIHMAVPKHDEARVYADFYAYHQKKYGNYPVARFAREVGRGEEQIRQAIKFCSLPEDIQQLVQEGRLRYGIACEIARLQDAGFPEDELRWWSRQALASNPKVEDFRETVGKMLFDRASGQTMLSLFTEAQEDLAKRLAFKHTVARNTIQALWLAFYYFKGVHEMFAQGKLGTEDSPYSLRSPVRVFRAVVEEEEKLLANLDKHLPRDVYLEAKRVIREMREVFRFLEGVLPDEEQEAIGLVPALSRFEELRAISATEN